MPPGLSMCCGAVSSGGGREKAGLHVVPPRHRCPSHCLHELSACCVLMPLGHQLPMSVCLLPPAPAKQRHHLQSHWMRWHSLCRLEHSSTPRRCHLYLGSCGPDFHSANQSSHHLQCREVPRAGVCPRLSSSDPIFDQKNLQAQRSWKDFWYGGRGPCVTSQL